MSAGTSEFFCLICLLLCSCTAQKIKKVELGQDVILPCKIPNNINDITAVEWIRPDLDPEYVLLYRDGLFDPDSQNPSYQNRVDLQDKEMKDGDVSLILKNVTMEDTGTYMCRVFQKGRKDLISTIYLKVYLSAQKIKKVELGQDVILPCKIPNINDINDITAVEWNRPGLDPEYVLLYRDGRLDPDNQHPSYQNRVDLQDKEMKDGNVSLILKNVKIEDNGRYECFAFQERKAELISIIYLEVVEPDHSWKIKVGVGVPLVVIILSAVCFAVYKIRQFRKMKKVKQEELEQLKRSHSKTSIELQTLKNQLEKWMDEKLKWMKTRRELRTEIQNQIQELKKLQDENQKLKETVGNLKTDHQDMDHELEPLAEHV